MPAPGDYFRIQKIALTLEESFDENEQLQKTQYSKNTRFTYGDYDYKTECKFYEVPSLGKQIGIPNELFAVGETLKLNYDKAEIPKNRVRLKYNNGKLEKINQQD